MLLAHFDSAAKPIGLCPRVNHTLGQRVSRLVRDTLSFSKKLANHAGAMKFFICHYNLVKAAA